MKRNFYLCLLAGFFLCFTSCAANRLTPRGEQNLEAWDRSMVYDPVTKRHYHTQNINESQMDPHFSDFHD